MVLCYIKREFDKLDFPRPAGDIFGKMKSIYLLSNSRHIKPILEVSGYARVNIRK